MFVFVSFPSVLNFNISEARGFKSLTKFLEAPALLKTARPITGAALLKTSNTLKFSGDKRLSLQLQIIKERPGIDVESDAAAAPKQTIFQHYCK